MAGRDLSPDLRKDPARSERFIQAYEDDLRTFFRGYLTKAREKISEDLDIRLTNLAIDSITVEAMISVLKGVATSVIPEAREISKQNADAAYKQGVRFGARELRRAGIRDAPSTLLPADWRALDWIEGRNLTVLEGITQDINDAIVREVSQGLLQGESIRDIAGRLEGIEGMTEDRAYKIARYETMFALNQGTILRYYQLGVERVEWISAGDDGHTCDECLDLDGKIFDIDSIPDCPLHVNCRCTVAPVVLKDYEMEIGMMVMNKTVRKPVMAALQQRIAHHPVYSDGSVCTCGGCYA